MNPLEKLMIITGHYGSGKTNFAINLAIMLAKQGEKVALADLDIVNPYFRSADFFEEAKTYGIQMILPPYANTNLDLPILSGAVDAAISSDRSLILDVGGDVAGATALGRYAPEILKKPYSMLYVMNFFRPMTETPEAMKALLTEIETISRLKVTHLVNNSNLAKSTTADDVRNTLFDAEKTGKETEKPLYGTAVEQSLATELTELPNIFPVDIFVKTPWT